MSSLDIDIARMLEEYTNAAIHWAHAEEDGPLEDAQTKAKAQIRTAIEKHVIGEDEQSVPAGMYGVDARNSLRANQREKL